jgi:FkbM family methyltransferase
VLRHDLNQIKNINNFLPEFIPIGFLEVGSLDGEDSIIISEHYKVNAYAIEPNRTSFEKLNLNRDKIFCYNFLASDKDGVQEFNEITKGTKGMISQSSVLISNSRYYFTNFKITVKAKRIDTFLNEENILVNFAKIDVEGFAYEVLVGFGERIKEFEAIQVETEKISLWKNQKLHNEVDELLISKGFYLADIYFNNNQYDCLYIRKHENN